MESQKIITHARDIVICGAGPVGVEFAGELVDVLKKDGKRCCVTLISGTTAILPQLDDRVGRHAMTILTRQGVKVVKGRKVVSVRREISCSKWTIELDNGTIMSPDCFISTTGPVPNNKFIPGQFLDEQGWMRVDAHSRAVSATTSGTKLSRVYGIGDIVAIHQVQ